jgi:hypothetical protein
VSTTSFGRERTRNHKDLSPSKSESPVELWEAQIVRNRQTQITDWGKAGHRNIVASNHEFVLSNVHAALAV